MASSLEKLESTHNVEVKWRSYELRPAGAPPPSSEYRARIEAGRPRLIGIAKETYGLDMNAGPWGINSRRALVGAKFAESQGKGKAFHDRVMRAYWQDARDISNNDELGHIAEDAGLNVDAFRAALGESRFDDEVQADENLAYEYGLQGVPALVFNDKYLVSGAQPLNVLQRAVEQIQKDEG